VRTGFVAKNKIVSLYIPEIYAIVRGKIGKPIEFGLSWGITRLRGGFLMATLAKDKLELQDSRFAVRAVKDHAGLFGKPQGVRLRSWRVERGERHRAQGARDRPRGRGSPWQSEVERHREDEGQVGFRTSASRRRYRNAEGCKVWVQPARREIGGGHGGMWTTLRLGIQPQQADERVGGAASSRTGRLISCGVRKTKPRAAQSGSPDETTACGRGRAAGQPLKLPDTL